MSQVPFQLLELSIISAQDLEPVSRKLQTYCVTWINPKRKLRTRIDEKGHINPSWNEKFVFRVDEKFMASETSAIEIDIYALGWLRDVIVGSVRVLISNLFPRSLREEKKLSSRRFIALQIRRPSGRPQGIVNIGITILDSTMKSMPLYKQLSASAVGFYDLMNEKENKGNDNPKRKANGEKKGDEKGGKVDEMKQLRRTLSDCTEINNSRSRKNEGKKASSDCNGSVANKSLKNKSSIVNGSEVGFPVVGKKGNGSEVGLPIVGKKGNGSLCSDVGPSPSIVAAAVARGLYPRPTPVFHKPGSSILEDWTVAGDSSVEGLKTKIDRWKMEIPSVYDNMSYQKLVNDNRSNHRRNQIQRRRKQKSGGSLFSCFGNAYGCEFTIVCGANGNAGRKLNRRFDADESIVSGYDLSEV